MARLRQIALGMVVMGALGGAQAQAVVATTAPATLSISPPSAAPPAACTAVASTAQTAGLNLTRQFFDDFDALSLETISKPGRWAPHHDGGTTAAGGFLGYTMPTKRTINTNAEQEFYVDPAYAGYGAKALGLSPFSVKNSILSITATHVPTTPSNISDLLGLSVAGLPASKMQFLSGMMTTRESFLQHYGYFEVRAKLPAGNALWPAFWLLGKTHGGWPPEIDVFEMVGQNPGQYATTVWYKTAAGATTHSGCWTKFATPITNDFHLYGVLWTKQRITFFYDRQPIVDIATPATLGDASDPMYMVLNLAVGGTMAGVADATTPIPSSLMIDWVAAYSVAN